MKLRNLIDKIESKYPTNLAYSWDNVGLLVGEYEKEVKKILVTLEANEKVVDEAIQKGVDLIITHHPFIFSKINRVNSGDLKGRLILTLIKNDISLYSMHKCMFGYHQYRFLVLQSSFCLLPFQLFYHQ